MKALITLAIIVGLYLFGRAIFTEYKKKEQSEVAAANAGSRPADGLEGMPAQFEASLQEAQAQGAPALKAWLDRYRPYLRDPKLAAIELDYAVLVSRSNPAEAQRVYRSVRQRVSKDSPVYERVKRLENTFGK